MWGEIFIIMLFSVLFLYWQSAQKVKEIALAATQRYCHDLDLQMLDGYVAHTGISLKKDSAGQFHIARLYQFEFSATGAERYNARIMMLGKRVESIQLEPHRF